jgi:Fe-S cluster assembly protein SufD
MTVDIAPSAPYLRQVAEAKSRLPGAGRLDVARDEAIARFRSSGLPTPKLEAWKFTNLGALARTAFHGAAAPPEPAPSKASLAPYRLTADCHLAVFVNGRFRRDLSDLDHLPAGTRVVSLSEANGDDLHALTAPPAIAVDARARALFDLNTAVMSDGAVVHLGRGVVIDPVQLLFVTVPDAEARVVHPRNLIRAEAGSSATVLEAYVALGDGTYWTNVVTQVAVARNAVLRHYKLQAEGKAAFHIAATSVRLDRQAAYRMFAASLGAELGRNELDIDLAETDGEAQLAGVTLARDVQHLDTTIRVDHSKPRGVSSQEFRSVVDERAHAVFQGRIRVAQDAQKTDARQVNRNLLLSALARADAKPELVILADDVKCSHGATVGDLDADALFYLRARGVGEPDARRLLIDAFIGELIEGIEGDAARTYFRRAIDERLAGGILR